MSALVRDIVITGGGTAGWLSAAIIASRVMGDKTKDFRVIVVESPDVPTIGVGEGTWPSMRSTLKKVGIRETDLVNNCDASFKQGTHFFNWQSDAKSYTHPFTPPVLHSGESIAEYMDPDDWPTAFDLAVCTQSHLFENHRAPKLISTPEYAGITNYGYHFDAAKMVSLLKNHCKEKLRVEHILATVLDIETDPSGNIMSLRTDRAGSVTGDFFIDCSGMLGLIIDKLHGVQWLDKGEHLFNDTALAIQVPYRNEDSPIASATLSTAQKAGWIWDIGLSSRRGIGYVYSSQHSSDEQSLNTLAEYLKGQAELALLDKFEPRKITFSPGYRERFWVKNSVAIGLSQGFVEPLEASALILVEQSAWTIANLLPQAKELLPIVGRKFNELFEEKWRQIIDFLKMHYVTSQRQESYWLDHRSPSSMHQDVADRLKLWRERPPRDDDFHLKDELFPPASYQYVLYGMGFIPRWQSFSKSTDIEDHSVHADYSKVFKQAQKLKAGLTSNRHLLGQIRSLGLKKI